MQPLYKKKGAPFNSSFAKISLATFKAPQLTKLFTANIVGHVRFKRQEQI